MNLSPPSDHDEDDREVTRLLKRLGSSQLNYPPELLAARRAAFLTQVEQLNAASTGEELSSADQEIIRLFRKVKFAEREYPPNLLAARRSAFLQQLAKAGQTSRLDRFRVSFQRLFSATTPAPAALRFSLVAASFLIAVLLGSLFLSRSELPLSPPPSQAATVPTALLPASSAAPTDLLPAGPAEVALIVCEPEEQTPPCLPAELTPDQDLADAGNGLARPAVAKDAQSNQAGVHRAAFVNDGRGGASWVSDSPESWIKIDLGSIRTINTVRLRRGNLGPSGDHDPGQFAIEVALSDVYAEGDSSHDYADYEPVFRSEQTGFSGTVSHTGTILAQFPPVRARFVKITFERAGAVIEEIGVFAVPPPVLVARQTITPQADVTDITLTPMAMDTPLSVNTVMSVPTETRLPTDTAVPSSSPTGTPSPTASNTPTPRPTNTQTPTDTATPAPADPLPSDTPIPLPTVAPPTVEPSPVGTEPIVVTGNDQSLTLTCYGNAVEIRGHVNTVTLLGSCSSITVTGNGNWVFWELGSPVITDRGTDNIIRQL